MPARACGECKGCCFLPAVPTIGKPACTLCPNARGADGCAIYADRPRECREYSCLWLSSELGEPGDRPDLLGLMFDRPTLVEEHPDYAGIPFVCARELRPAARDEPRAAELLLRFSRQWVVRLTGLDGRTQLLGPRSLIDTLVARARARR